MKRNVDLTMDRRFSSRFSDIMAEFLPFSTRGFPWNPRVVPLMTDNDLKEHSESRSLTFPTGNKEQREKIKYYQRLDSLEYCDCCGKRLNVKPWDHELCICNECHIYYSETQVDKCKWRRPN